jgi:hypothetical protein
MEIFGSLQFHDNLQFSVEQCVTYYSNIGGLYFGDCPVNKICTPRNKLLYGMTELSLIPHI